MIIPKIVVGLGNMSVLIVTGTVKDVPFISFTEVGERMEGLSEEDLAQIETKMLPEVQLLIGSKGSADLLLRFAQEAVEHYESQEA
ncbi:hypothetical protein D3C85_274470 [compost metagenome]